MEPNELNDKPKFNWKRLLITVGIVIVTAGAIGGSVYYVMNQQAQKDKESAEKTAQDLQGQMEELKKTDNVVEEGDTEKKYTDISVVAAKSKMDADPSIVVVDVSPYYKNGHIPGAVNYPVGSGALDKAIPTMDKNKTYIVYCHADVPAISGAQKLVDAGMAKVYRIIGNYQAWVDAGYEIEK